MAKTPADHRSTRYTQSFVGGEGSPAELRLQLTKQRQFLSIEAGEVSDLAGLDVVRPWRRADPSVPLDVQIDQSLQPISQAFASAFEGIGTRVYVGAIGFTATDDESHLMYLAESGNVPASIRIGTAAYSSFFGGNGWPSDLADGNSRGMEYPADIMESDSTTPIKPIAFRITGVKTYDNPNDTIEIDRDLGVRPIVIVTASVPINRRGIIVTDGREFRLLQGGKYDSEPLLTVDEAQKGDTWRMARISNTRMLLVSDANVPRVIVLGGSSIEQLLMAHNDLFHTRSSNQLEHATHNWLAGLDASASASMRGLVFHVASASGDEAFSSISVGSVVKRINGLASSNAATASSTGVAGKVENEGRGMARFAGPPPMITSVVDDAGPNEAVYMNTSDPLSGAAPIATRGDASVLIRLLDLETNAASPFFQAGAGDAESNGGREAVFEIASALRLNLKFQRGKFIFPHRSQVIQIYRKLSNGSDYFLEKEIPMLAAGLSEFRPQSETEFHVILQMSDVVLQRQPILSPNERVRGVPPAGRDVAVLADTGTVLIAGKTDMSRFKNPTWGDGRYKYEWPKVRSDNVVHFSRTDILEPENFPPTIRNQIVLSRIGDKFQRFVQAGEDVLAVMSEGVYRLTSGGSLGVSRRVVGESGIGTPWPDSVISVRQKAMWVGASNVYLYDRTAEGTDRQSLVTIGDDLYPWIRSAAKDGDNIKCAFDPRRQVVIIRRIKTDGTFQDIELSLRGSSSSFMEDRHGADFVSSPYADVTDQGHSLLYAVGQQGDVREIGRETEVGDSHPYDTFEQQVVLDETHTIDDGSVTKAAAFTTAMIGDTVRFKSSNADVDGQVRKIKSVSHVADSELVEDNGAHPSLIMLDSRNGFIGYKDNDLGGMIVRKISIADDGVVTIDAGFVLSVAGMDSLCLTPWGRGLAFFFIQSVADNRPAGGAILYRDGILRSVTPGQSVELEATAVQRDGLACVNIDGNNIIQVWREITSPYKIDVVAVPIGDTGAMKAVESFNITTIASVDASTKAVVARLTDTIALSAYHAGGNLYVAVITFDGELITEVDTGLVEGQTSASFYIIPMTPTTFVILYGQVGTNFKARHGTVDTDPDSSTYGAVTYGTALTIFTGVSTGLNTGIRMTDDSLIVAYSFGTGPFFNSLVVNSDNSLTLKTIASLTGTVLHHEMRRLSDTRFIYTVNYDDGKIYVMIGTMYGTGKKLILNVGAPLTYGPPDTIAFDDVAGLAEGDTMIIGSVPFRIRFAPVIGLKARNTKLLDGISAWIKPDGRTVTTTKEITAKIRRNLADSDEVLNRTEETEVTIPIKAPSEVSSQDEDFFADIHVSGKMLELEISNDDADTGLSIVTLAGVVKETGDMQGDRSTTG